MSSPRYLCIHGHFYQPPRENAWLEMVAREPSAHPFHDWNERILEECYGPNGASRILDTEGRIMRIVNNYARINFNFGPTLLSWMQEFGSKTYERIVEADRESIVRFSGHGSAIAQVYNHIILPLANRRDKETQVIWGIRDFELRFSRKPEGMWLAETAADIETLEVLAEHGIRFTILAPHQAARMRPRGSAEWIDVSGGRIPPGRVYEQRLPSGRSIALFFYDGPISRAVAFERLLSRGENFVGRLFSGFGAVENEPQLMHIATDGETYGHHHRFGDMALAYALDLIEQSEDVRLTNYAEFLALHPPHWEVEIFENSSWSCAHGVERWRRDCGCASGMQPDWHQQWREPLRGALDYLRDEIAELYEQEAAKYFHEPWRARNEYIDIVLEASDERMNQFFGSNASHVLSPDELSRAMMLLEMQRHGLLMYTSCGWFFDEISGLESVQVLRYAARALQLAAQFGRNVEGRFVEILSNARSNVAAFGDGRAVFERLVKPAVVDLETIAGHFAVSSLFEEYGSDEYLFGYRVDRTFHRVGRAGRARLTIGQATITAERTREARNFTYCALHLGDHNLGGAVKPADQVPLEKLVAEAERAFSRADLAETLRTLDRHFGELRYSLASLLHDEQARILDHILAANLDEAHGAYRQVYEMHAPLMRFLSGMNLPVPRAFATAAELVLNTYLERALGEEEVPLSRVRELLDEASALNVPVDKARFSRSLSKALVRQLELLQLEPDSLDALQQAVATAGLLREMPLDVPLTEAQEIYYSLWQGPFAELRTRVSEEAHSERWREFVVLGKALRVAVELQ